MSRPASRPVRAVAIPAFALLASLAATVMLAGTPAIAVETPSSAVSESRVTPPALVDHPNLLHTHPQYSATLDPMFLLSAEGRYSSYGSFAAIYGSGRARGFLGTRPFFAPALGHSVTIIHGGASWHHGGLRVGAGFGVGRNLAEDSDLDTNPEGEERVGATEEETTITEGVLGLGFEGGFGSFDVTWGVYREDASLWTLRSSPLDTTTFRLESDPPILSHVAVRTEIPFGDRFTLVGTGSFREHTVVQTVDGFDREGLVHESYRAYGHAWATGLSVAIPASTGTTTHVFGQYENDRSPTSHRGYDGYRALLHETTQIATERIHFGLSFERPLWKEISLLAGFRSLFTIRAQSSKRVESDGNSELRHSVDEDLTQSFGWGVRGQWRNLDLAGAMRKDLAISNLFLRVDASLRY